MTWYLGITTTRKIAPFPGAEKERGEFAVVRQLQAMGIEAHAPVRITFLRKGKRRYAEPETEVLLPNYVFADIPDDLYHAAIRARGLAPTLMAISRADMTGVRKDKDQNEVQTGKGLSEFITRANAKAEEARRIIDRNDRAAMCQFDPGDMLEILSGPFMNQVVRFTRMVSAAHEMHPMVGFEGELFGRAVPGVIDPLDVRKAV